MRWIPLEANPEVMNEYIKKLGIDKSWKFMDLYSLDSEMLSFVPQPVLSLLLLYPLSSEFVNSPMGVEAETSGLMFIKQTVGNACGTVAILHSLANNLTYFSIKDDCFLHQFLSKISNLSPLERGLAMEDEKELSDLHEQSASEGQTESPSVDTRTNLHFISLIHHNGILYELDGRKDSPISHGPTSQESFLQDACNVVKKFMALAPDSNDFSLIALCSSN